MAAALSLVHWDSTRRKVKRIYKVTLSGSYTALGDVLDFTAATATGFPNVSPAPGYGAGVTNADFIVHNPGGVGYLFRVEKGTTFANWKFRIFQSDDAVDPLDEISGSIPSDLTGDANIFIELILPNGY